MKITLIGIGPGGHGSLTGAALEALEGADALIGAARMLDSLPDGISAQRAAMFRPDEILRWLEDNPRFCRVCIVYSGDTGFHSGANGLRPLLERAGHEVETICGVPTISWMCARLGLAWEDLSLFSAHGTDLDVVAHVLNNDRCFFLTGGDVTPAVICSRLAACGLGGCEVAVAERLSYPDEKITTGSAEQLMEQDFAPLSAVIVRRTVHAFTWDSRSGGIPDGELIRGKAPMTKREVRAVIMSRLRLREDETAWDIGAGTGSVAVEMALAARWGRVFAFEREEEAFRLIGENRVKFGVYNLTSSLGSAPDCFGGAPAPDAAFIGGSGGRLREIMAELIMRNPRVRVVVSAITLETVSETAKLLDELGFDDIEIAQIAVSRAEKVGGSRMLKALNPIFILGGQGRGGA